MLRGRFGLLIALAVVAMLSVAAGAGYLIVNPPLPDPSVATREQLFRWLVLRDLGKEPVEIRKAILARLDSECGKAGEMGATIEQLADSHRKMLWHNVTVLLESWFLGKAQQYHGLPADQRTAFVDRFLDQAEQWKQVGSACMKNRAAVEADGGDCVSKLVMEQIGQCGTQADPAEREQIGQFMAAVQTRWLWRQMPSFSLFGRAAKS